MQLIPGSFDTKLLRLMSAAVDAAARSSGYVDGQYDDARPVMARSVISAASRGERDPVELQRLALLGIATPSADDAEQLPSLPITHRYSA
jgi:hypothetical protein